MLTFWNQPKQAHATINWLLPLLLTIALVLTPLGLYLAFIWSPMDYQQGETVRIMYIHVPASWGAMLCYLLMAILSAYALIKRVMMPLLLTRAFAYVGLWLCLLSLATGSIWGKPTWGAWWVWDARLTSMFVLALLYGSYHVAASLFQHATKGLQVGAFIAVFGSINLPIIKWSVEWWHTLHQPASIMRLSKPAIHWQMLVPLSVMALAMASLSLALIVWRWRLELWQHHLHHLQVRQINDAN